MYSLEGTEEKYISVIIPTTIMISNLFGNFSGGEIFLKLTLDLVSFFLN